MALLSSHIRAPRRPPQPTGHRSLARVLSAVVRHARLLQLLLVAVGVLGLCLVVPLLERKIEFDENALLAGSARPTISLSGAYDAGRAFADALQHTYHTHVFSSALQQALAAAGLQVSHHAFRSSRAVTTYDAFGSSSAVRECVNVHAVLHSQRGDGKEALVLVTPINHQHFVTDFQQDVSGVRLSLALGYALLQHLSAAAWLSKEVVWLLPDASCGLLEAVTAWTDAYQLLPLDKAGSEPTATTFRRAGVLQQALLLELPCGAFNRVQVALEGHAGQLPKLDMFWIYRWYAQAYITAPVELPQQQQQLSGPLQLLQRALQRTLLPLLSLALSPLLPQQHSSSSSSSGVLPLLDQLLSSHLHKLQVMAHFMGRQAAGLPTGAHAAFKGLGVDAATLRLLLRNDAGRVVGPLGYTGGGNAGASIAWRVGGTGGGGAGGAGSSGGAGGVNDDAAAAAAELGDMSSQILVGFDSALHQLGNVMEAALRSCSVLIERFHHSLFLYVLTGLNSYVSVERYIAPLVALIGVLVLQAAHLNSSSSSSTSKPPETAAAAAPDPGNSNPAAAAAAAAAAVAPDTSAGLRAVLQSQALQLPRCQAGAALARQQWVSALQLVLLTHAASLAAGAALWSQRGQQQQQQHSSSLSWGAAEGLAGTVEGQGLTTSLRGVGAAGVLLALLLAGESLLSLFASSSSRSNMPSSSSSASSRGQQLPLRQVCLRKVLVVELSLAAAVLAAIACINWALGYVTCLVLVPLAMATGGSSTSSRVQRVMQLTTLVCCSPVALLVCLRLTATPAVGVAGTLQWLQWLLVQGSSLGSCLVAFGVYLPCWGLVCAASIAGITR